MKIFGICLIKNEIDIIEYCLSETSKYTDVIIVYDNGSTDGTWELVQELAKKNDKIIPWKSDGKPYHDGLRAEAFKEFRHLSKKGDWWSFIDADEFYIDEPRQFLMDTPKKYHVVKTESFEYKMTFEDVEEFEFQNHFPEDLDKIKYYNPRTYSERRFFRYRPRLVWPEDRKYPLHVGIISPKNIRLQHFQYRSPQQIKSRVQTRIQATKDGYKHFGRDNVEDWKEKLVHRKELIKETPEFKREWIYDVNIKPWHRNLINRVLHTIGYYP